MNARRMNVQCTGGCPSTTCVQSPRDGPFVQEELVDELHFEPDVIGLVVNQILQLAHLLKPLAEDFARDANLQANPRRKERVINKARPTVLTARSSGALPLFYSTERPQNASDKPCNWCWTSRCQTEQLRAFQLAIQRCCVGCCRLGSGVDSD